MKKYIIIAVASILAFSGCSNINDNQNTPQEMTFTAGFSDGVQTRATLDPSTKKVGFDAGDQISILSEENNNVTFTTTAGGASATFTGTATADATYYAIYPYQDGLILSFEGKIVGLEIPINQSAAALSTCGWDPAAPLAYATTTGTSFEFHNLCALLKVTNDRGYDVDITIQDLNDVAKMTGHYEYNISTGTLTGGNPVVLVQGVPADKTVYIAIAPCTVGHLVAICDDGGSNVGCKTKTSDFTFEAGKIYDLGNTSTWTEDLPMP